MVTRYYVLATVGRVRLFIYFIRTYLLAFSLAAAGSTLAQQALLAQAYSPYQFLRSLCILQSANHTDTSYI